MTFAEDLWLRGKAAQSSMIQLMAYNSAIAGTATIQVWKLGLSAPVSFWQAVGRAGGLAPAPRPAARRKPAPKPKLRTSAPAAVPPAPAAPAPAPVASARAAKAPSVPPSAKPAARPAPAPAPTPSAAAKPAAKPKPKPVAKAKPKAAPKPAPEPAAAVAAQPGPGPSPHLLDAPRGGKADDLTVLSGVGEKLATALNEFGIYHFDQIATLDAEGIEWLNEQQPGFKMIAARYKVIDQAKARLAE
jgi:predicted flap endonuclease-1-like 5' DNA nuclease